MRPPFLHRRDAWRDGMFAPFRRALWIAGWGIVLPLAAVAGEAVDLAALVEQNRRLTERLDAQQAEILQLRDRIDALSRTETTREAPAIATADPAWPEEREAPDAGVPVSRAGFDRRIVLSGEFSVAYFDGGSESKYPNGEFRVDDANIYIEAELARQLYAFAELQISKRESPDEYFHLGELYLEWENPLAARLPDRALTLRLGRLDVPFGEEYLHRDPMANPLISHSLSDFWGTDEGVAAFGQIRRFDYIVAVQNGGQPITRDAHPDKAWTVRAGVQATPRLRLSASAFHTGRLDTEREALSEMWIGNAVFRSIGSADTRTFTAGLWQVDAAYRWKGGHLLGAWGRGNYDDDDPSRENARSLTFHHLEAAQDVNPQLFVAARYSALHADAGYPMPGNGALGRYFFGPWLTEDLWRLSLGVGYRLSRSAVMKFEYSWEEGELTDGTPRRGLNQLAAQAALAF